MNEYATPHPPSRQAISQFRVTTSANRIFYEDQKRRSMIFFFLIVKCQARSATIVTGPKPEKGKQRKKRNPLRLCKLKSVGLPACTRRKKLNWSRRITDGHCLHRLVGQFRKKARLAEKKPLKGQRAQCMHSYINDFRAQLKACRVVYVGPNRWACL